MAFEKTKKRLAEALKRKRLKKVYKKEGMEKKAAKTKAKEKAKAPETGKVRRGAKGVESTKGGEYVKYGKKSKAAKSFREAFKAAKGKDFKWDGRSYSGKTADDVKKEKAAKAAKAVKTPTSKKELKERFATPGDKEKQVMASGGKVESNPFGWPTRDARNGGNS